MGGARAWSLGSHAESFYLQTDQGSGRLRVMTNTTPTSSTTGVDAVTPARRVRKPLLGIALLGAVALAVSGCYDEAVANEIQGGAAVEESSDSPTPTTQVQDAPDAQSLDDEPDGDAADGDAADGSAAPIRDLSASGEGENVYVDDSGTLRNAGTDEPVCPNPLPADGRDADGDYILIDGRSGLPLCGPDGEFLTIDGDHEDTEVEEGVVPLTPEREFLLEQLDLGWSDGVRCVITSGESANVSDVPCLFLPSGGGSFSIQSADGSTIVNDVQIISVSIIEEGEAEVRGLTRDGINARWGAATRSDSEPACWAGEDFEVCAF